MWQNFKGHVSDKYTVDTSKGRLYCLQITKLNGTTFVKNVSPSTYARTKIGDEWQYAEQK